MAITNPTRSVHDRETVGRWQLRGAGTAGTIAVEIGDKDLLSGNVL
jgi:hypothetical protein